VSDQGQHADLIGGIAQDAAREAERILGEAERAAEDRKQAAEDQAQAVLQQGEAKVQEQAVQEVLKRVRERLAERLGNPEYREVLLAWIVEAAIGLGAAEATVNASAAERKQIDKRLLQDAQNRVNELSGRKVSLKQADEDPLIPQGVVLKAADGRVEFNNQVATRLLRRQSEIRKTIQDVLWKNESSGR
jgi:vacuolar-type H+-ATPase subunit E/Vma4